MAEGQSSSLIAEWLVAGGTIALALVAAFQDSIRARLTRPKLGIRMINGPPDCHGVPMTRTDTGAFITDCVYFRVWVENRAGRLLSRSPAKNVEVYASRLRKQQANGTWSEVATFPPMNLKWSHIGVIYFPSIAPGMGKHCDIGHVIDPAVRGQLAGENNPALQLRNNETSIVFDLIVAPNHKGHIVGSGRYELDITVAAENAKPETWSIKINNSGQWYGDEARMLRDGIGVNAIKQ